MKPDYEMEGSPIRWYGKVILYLGVGKECVGKWAPLTNEMTEYRFSNIGPCALMNGVIWGEQWN